ncbi:cystathione beta-lyase [Parapedobacter composti]|uniref:cysteine-S-conjugate beta-lyase n=1 Tax=Parapedobacter composti TaxID=623281 RepID=A0A1I1FXU1_9SPHI|nr:MalY/PatB family protein [Parapedobacter composti]SFC04115.1 cystathione beta-lyase [Parapedobacter composti]
MDYHFDEPVDRKNTDSIKWDAAEADVLPMWVADMDFKAAPAIVEALQNRVAHGVFGYTQTPQRFYDAIVSWWHKRHGFTLQPHWLLPVTGVIPALSATIQALTAPGDKILVQPPVYNHFFMSISNSGRQVVENPLHFQGGHYQIAFDDLEAKAADPAVTLLLLSNPHNPVGRVWTAEELRRIGDICARHGVVVVSDEIHSDLVFGNHKHTPFASLEQEHSLRTVTISSPSKTFNLAGLQVAYLFSEREDFRKRIQEVFNTREMALLTPFAIEALIAAYEQGDDWLEALKTYLTGNLAHLTAFCATHLPHIAVVPLQATYLVWLDCRAVITSTAAFADKLRRQEKLWLNPGTLYGQAGEGFLRINIACPRSLLNDGLSRLVRGFRLADQP